MTDPIPGNGEPQPELESSPLEYILDLKARGDLSRPPIKYIKEAQTLAKYIDNPEEKREAQEHLDNLEALQISQILALLKKIDAAESDPSKSLSRSQIDFLRKNIDGVPAAELEKVNSILEKSEEILLQKESQRKNQRKQVDVLLGKVNREMAAQAAMNSGDMTLVEIGPSLTADEKKKLLASAGPFGLDLLTGDQIHFLETGKVPPNSAESSVDAANARIALNIRDQQKNVPTEIVPQLATQTESKKPLKSLWDKIRGR